MIGVSCRPLAQPHLCEVPINKESCKGRLDEMWEKLKNVRRELPKGHPLIALIRSGRFEAEHADLTQLYFGFWFDLFCGALAEDQDRPVMHMEGLHVYETPQMYVVRGMAWFLPHVKHPSALEAVNAAFLKEHVVTPDDVQNEINRLLVERQEPEPYDDPEPLKEGESARFKLRNAALRAADQFVPVDHCLDDDLNADFKAIVLGRHVGESLICNLKLGEHTINEIEIVAKLREKAYVTIDLIEDEKAFDVEDLIKRIGARLQDQMGDILYRRIIKALDAVMIEPLPSEFVDRVAGNLLAGMVAKSNLKEVCKKLGATNEEAAQDVLIERIGGVIKAQCVAYWLCRRNEMLPSQNETIQYMMKHGHPTFITALLDQCLKRLVRFYQTNGSDKGERGNIVVPEKAGEIVLTDAPKKPPMELILPPSMES